MAEKKILADIDHPGHKLLEQLADFFDAVFATQVFEHVSRPWLSAKHIFQLLRPGGRVFFTVPFLARYHNSPEDHFRFTVYGAIKIFRDAGFVVNQSYVGK
jgi:2-polyprenyl-3-methyl-5-hydroxy-6-metoxy-1,4-benzoquinol methylase